MKISTRFLLTAACVLSTLTFAQTLSASTNTNVLNSVKTPLCVSISVSPVNGLLHAGVKAPYVAMASFSDGSTQNVTRFATWSSNYPAIASVDNNGVVSANHMGHALISARFAGAMGNTGITVIAL